MAARGPGKLIVLSGPSGAGKTTVLRRVLEESKQPLVVSISATTRPPRKGERDGGDYHFLSDEEFARLRRQGEFLECFEVFGKGHWYGTLKSEVAPGLEKGKWVVLEIDVQGAQSVVKHYPDAITIFVCPSSMEEVERRLRGRNTETEAAIERRLERARHEVALSGWYQHKVINDDVDHAVQEICDILNESGG